MSEQPTLTGVFTATEVCIGGTRYHAATLTYTAPFVAIQGWRWRAAWNKHELSAQKFDFEALYAAAEDPSDHADWPKEMRQTWWDKLCGRPGTEHYVRVVSLREPVNFAVPVAKIDWVSGLRAHVSVDGVID